MRKRIGTGVMHKLSNSKYRVLIVDDEPSVLETSALVLTSEGYEVRTARDGLGALVELRRSAPDLLISDLTMPNLNGFELLSIVREEFPGIPVIAVSGRYCVNEFPQVRADAHFIKGSYAHEDLFLKINELLDRSPIFRNDSKSN